MAGRPMYATLRPFIKWRFRGKKRILKKKRLARGRFKRSWGRGRGKKIESKRRPSEKSSSPWLKTQRGKLPRFTNWQRHGKWHRLSSWKRSKLRKRRIKLEWQTIWQRNVPSWKSQDGDGTTAITDAMMKKNDALWFRTAWCPRI